MIGAVLVHGAKAPYVIRREQLSLMKRQAVLVDVSIDQGGCFETSRPTTHTDPTYEVDGVLHYCVANMPGAVPVTSTRALTNATLPYVLHVADVGVEQAVAREPGAGEGRQRGRRQGHLPAGGGGDGPAVRRAVRGAGPRRRLVRRRHHRRRPQRARRRRATSRARGAPCSCSSAATTSAAPPCPSGRGRASTRACRATPTSSRCCRGRWPRELGLASSCAGARSPPTRRGRTAAGCWCAPASRRTPPGAAFYAMTERVARGGLPDADRAAALARASCARESPTTPPGRRCSSARWARRWPSASRTTSSAGSSPPTG